MGGGAMTTPCAKCGTADRYKSGNCKVCLRSQMRAYHKTEKGKSVKRKYSRTEKGKAAHSNAGKKYYKEHYVVHWLRRLRKRSREAALPFNITSEDLVVPSHCPILGIPLFRKGKVVGPNSPSADKILPALGYVKGNVRVISQLANAMKQHATPEQLLTFCANMPKYLEGLC